MLVVIDAFGEGHVQVINTDPELWFPVTHPDGSGITTIDVVLKYMSDNPMARQTGGWNELNKIFEETEPLTRWQRLVRACNGPGATEQARSLGLTE
jgi:hypothetical protein